MDRMNTLAEFLSFFKAIPDEKWCSGHWHLGAEQRCALGHLGINVPNNDGKDPDIMNHNRKFLEGKIGTVPTINDNQHPKYHQTHPKERVIAAIREKMEAEMAATIAAVQRAAAPAAV